MYENNMQLLQYPCKYYTKIHKFMHAQIYTDTPTHAIQMFGFVWTLVVHFGAVFLPLQPM